MKNQAPRLPGLPTISALMVSAMIAVWLGIFGPISLGAIKEWQAVISASVAAIGIAVAAVIAVRNVSRQIRINILLRVEDRIEKQLPGLKHAQSYLGRFVYTRAPVTTDFFIKEGFGLWYDKNEFLPHPNLTPDKDVEGALPHTDLATRAGVARVLHQAFATLVELEQDQELLSEYENELNSRKQWEPSEFEEISAKVMRSRDDVQTYRTYYRECRHGFEAEMESIGRKIMSFEARLENIRSEIETYFGNQ